MAGKARLDVASGGFRSRALDRAVRRIIRGAKPKQQMSVGEIADRLSQLGPLYLLLAVACIAVSPLSGIPLVTTVCGFSIAALSLQLLLGWRAAWLPDKLRRRTVQIQRLQTELMRADSVAGRVEAIFDRRLVWLTRGPARALLLCLCIFLGLTMPLLEVIPFAGTAFAFIVLVITTALLMRDGVAALLAGAFVSAVLVTTAILIVSI